MIRRYVVDASVAAKWYFPEAHSEHADALLEEKSEILAPGLLFIEIAALVWKRARRGEISETAADRVTAELRKVPLEIVPTVDLVAAAIPLALQKGLTLHEAFYVALAIQNNCPLVTADRRLYDLLRGGALADHALWIADVG